VLVQEEIRELGLVVLVEAEVAHILCIVQIPGAMVGTVIIVPFQLMA
jgi:hypothetical protein